MQGKINLIFFLALSIALLRYGLAEAGEGDLAYEEPNFSVTISDKRDRQSELLESEAGFTAVIELPQGAAVVSAAELLEKEAGVSVRSLGGLGGFALVSMRGSSAEQTAIFIDGVPLSTAASEGFDLSTISLAGVSRIEIYRGYAPFSLGGSPLGGAINIVTRKQAASTFTFSALYGSFLTRGLSAGLNIPSTGGRFYGSASYLGSNGDFDYLDDYGTKRNPEDDVRRSRENNHFNQGEFRTGVSKIPLVGDLELSAGIEGFAKKQGVPGRGNIQSGEASLSSQRYGFNFLAERDRKGDGLFAGAFAGGFAKLHRFEDRKGDISFNPLETFDKNFFFSIAPYAGYRYAPFGETALKVDVGNEFYSPSYIYPEPSDFPLTHRIYAEPALTQEFWAIAGTLAFEAQGRAKYLRDATGENPIETLARFTPRRYEGWTLSAQGGARIKAYEGLWIRASGGYAERPPDFAEMFGDKGFRIGNSELKPESGWFADGGFTFTAREVGFINSIYAQETVYYRRVKDLIWLVKYGNFPSKSENIGKADFLGAETKLTFEAFNHLGLRIDYAFIRAINRSEIPYQKNKKLPYNPAHEFTVSPRLFNEFFEIAYEIYFASESYYDRANIEKLDSRLIHNINLKLQPSDKFALTLAVKNLSDNRVSDYEGYPLPGFSAFVGISGSL